MAEITKSASEDVMTTGNMEKVATNSGLSVADGELQVCETAATKQTMRSLRPRHIQLMAISGAIGTGLFVGSGSALARAGPLGLLLGYSIYAVMVWSTFNAVGEMVCWLPVDGSFVVFAHAYLDDAWGFAMGWLYTITMATCTAGEIAAVAAIFEFWTDAVNSGVYVAIVVASLLALNVFGVRIYGEGEFYFSMFKIFLILGLLMMTFIVMVGGNPQHDAFGFRYWKNPGPMHAYVAEGSWGEFLGFWSVLIQAAYAFGGPDYIALAAGETRAPRRVLPSVFKRVIFRLIFFYVLGVLAVGILVPYDDPDLTSGKPGAGASPFVIGIVRLKIPVLPHIINALLITSAWSCGLELFYASSRSLYALAVDGKTPRFMLKTFRGVPIYCVMFIWAISFLAFMSVSNNSLTVFNWITNIVGSGILLIAIIFHTTYIRFRKAQIAQGVTDDQRPWYRKHQLTYSYISLPCYTFVYLTNGWVVFTKGNWSVASFIFAYFSLAIFLVCYLGYKIFKRPVMAKPINVPLYAGRSSQDMDDGYTEPEPVTRWLKFLRWLWG